MAKPTKVDEVKYGIELFGTMANLARVCQCDPSYPCRWGTEIPPAHKWNMLQWLKKHGFDMALMVPLGLPDPENLGNSDRAAILAQVVAESPKRGRPGRPRRNPLPEAAAQTA